MKKLLLILAVFALFSFVANAQENAIKVNPLAILGGTDLLSYERAFNDNMSGVISGAYGGFKIAGIKYTSAGAGLQYRYYFSEVLDGWYGAAALSYQNGKVKAENATLDVTVGGNTSSQQVKDEEIGFSAFGGGAKIGHQWVWDSGFTLDLNLGANYSSFNYDDTDNSTFSNLKASGVLPTFGFALGYAF